MNLNTLSGSAKLYKKLEICATGQNTASGEVPNIAILCAVSRFENQKLVSHVASGIKAKGGMVSVIDVPSFGYFNKINPMTAKYAASFMRSSASTAEASIKCGLYDGAVIIADCDITAAGLLEGAARANCPTLLLPIGTCISASGSIQNYRIQGLLTSRKINAHENEKLIAEALISRGIPHILNSVSTFFILMEAMGFCVPGASLSHIDSGAHFRNAAATGEAICESAKSVFSPKKFLTLTALRNAITLCLCIGGDISAISTLSKLVSAYESKIPHSIIAEVSSKTDLLIAPENQNCNYLSQTGGVFAILKQLSSAAKLIDESMLTYTCEKLKNVLVNNTASELVCASKTSRIILAKGSACEGGGYCQPAKNTPVSFSGKAWVYSSIEEADKALVAGNIPDGSVVVVQNCPDTYVSALAYTIEGMDKQSQIAIVTDGLCDKTSVLTVTSCSPNSLANEEFANIQNGDLLEIDLGRGRFNTNILAKDQKNRAKKNDIRKQIFYFN